ncbi:MAG: glycosyltransferase family protein [Candidatus Hodarchaeales archaeon]|jgi:hypothetical protein
MGKVNILLLSIHYPFAIKNYFENALRRRPDIDLVTTGPFTGKWIPWMGGMEVNQKYAISPTYPMPFKPSVGRVNYELVRAQMPSSWKPDLMLTIDAGINWTHRPSEGIIASVFTDGHCLDYAHARDISDYSFNLHPSYSDTGDAVLHYAYDPGMHYPMSDVEKDADAVLIGMPYPRRVEWVDTLRAQGISVLFENGPIFDEYRELNNRARIGLNWSSDGAQDMNARVFELMAMRLCPVINRVPDLHLFFEEDRHYLGFSTFDEAVEKVVWAKEHPEEAQMIADMAYQNVTQKNLTYDKLVLDILKECRLV